MMNTAEQTARAELRTAIQAFRTRYAVDALAKGRSPKANREELTSCVADAADIVAAFESYLDGVDAASAPEGAR